MTEAYTGNEVDTLHRGYKWKVYYKDTDEDADVRAVCIRTDEHQWEEIGTVQRINHVRWIPVGCNGVRLAYTNKQQHAAQHIIDHWLALKKRKQRKRERDEALRHVAERVEE